MKNPGQNPGMLYRMTQQFKEAQLLFAGIELDIFSHLSAEASAIAVAGQTGYDARNLALFLNSLVAIGLLKKNGECFQNTPVAEVFLNRHSSFYLGEYLVFWNEMTSLHRVAERVRLGPDVGIQQHNQGGRVYNFRELARLSATEIYTGRVQSFLQAIRDIFSPASALRLLDLGGGSGMMAIECAAHFPQASGVIFEHPLVADIPEQFVKERGLASRLAVWHGDFTTDDIGTGYDLIIASGILDFASADLPGMANRIAEALQPQGYLYLVSHQVGEDFLTPKESIVNWLSSHLDGLNLLQSRQSIDAALAAAGLTKMSQQAQAGVISGLVGELYHFA